MLKKIHESINEKINSSFDIGIDKLIDCVEKLKNQTNIRKLKNTDITASVTIGIFTIGISKRVNE